jgi:hypothetical protein
MLPDVVETLGERTLVCLLLCDWLKELFCGIIQYRAKNLLQREITHLQNYQQRTALYDSRMSRSIGRGRMSSVPITSLDNLDISLCTSWHPPSSQEALRVHRKFSPRLRRIDLLPKIRVSTPARGVAVNQGMKPRLTYPNGKLENSAYASWNEYFWA